MADYSSLSIGDFVTLYWKYEIPEFIIFLFDESDFYSKRIQDEEEEECWEYDIGYKSTCGKCLEILNNYGYNLEFFAEIYDMFHDELIDNMNNYLDYNYETEEKLNIIHRMNKFPEQSHVRDLSDFIEFLKEVVANDIDIMDDDSLKEFALKFSPTVMKVVMLFDEDYFNNYPEIIFLMYARLILEAMPREQEIYLNLTPILMDEEYKDSAKQVYENLTFTLTRKVHLYNRTFKVLLAEEKKLKEMYAKTKIQSLLKQLQNNKDKYEKGILLEELMNSIFETDPGFKVTKRRWNTGDEEIDLIIKNDMQSPFWLSWSSPLIFVECKNWMKPVGTKEIRDFEVKLQNHKKFTKIGIFVAPGGFTSECHKELSRLSREDYIMILIENADLENFANGPLSGPEWLEEILCRPI